MIEIFLGISVLINVLFILYSRWLIRILTAKEQDVNILADDIADYVNHVKSVHEMEIFYGEPTLQALIEHGTKMVEKIEQFDFIIREESTEEAPEQ